MASSFGEAFAKSFQAEMARRKDAEAEIEREIRAEARLNREMQERRAINTESELAREARAIEAERRLEERAKVALDESRLYDKREKSLAKEEELNRRLAAVGSKRLGEGSVFQPTESQYGIPPTQEELISLAAAERELQSRLKSEGAGAEAFARDMAGIKAYGTPEATRQRSERESRAELLASRDKWDDAFLSLSPADRKQIETSGGMPTLNGLEQLKRRFDQQTVESTDPTTGNTIRKKTSRLLKEDVLPLDSGAAISSPYDVQPEPAPSSRQGVMQKRLLAERANRENAAISTAPAIPTLPSQELSEEDQDFFSYLDKIRKHPAVKPVEFISGPGQYATKLALEGLTESELWKKYGPSDKLKESLTPPWARPAPPATPPIKPWSQDYFTR